MKKKFTKFFLTCAVLLNAQVILAATYTVTNTLDSGPGSLRQAVTDANANPGADIIKFQINTTGNLFEGSGANTYAVIELATVLPIITEAVTIDGTTQTNTNTGSMAAQLVGADALTA